MSTETRPPEGYATWLDFAATILGNPVFTYGDVSAKAAEVAAKAELANLRAQCERLRGERDEEKAKLVKLESAVIGLNHEHGVLITEADALRAENEREKAAMLDLLRDVTFAMGSHGPCRNNSCRDCQRTWKKVNAALGNAQEARDANK